MGRILQDEGDLWTDKRYNTFKQEQLITSVTLRGGAEVVWLHIYFAETELHKTFSVNMYKIYRAKIKTEFSVGTLSL